MAETRAQLTGVRLRAKSGEWLVHPDLRARMVADAQAKGTNLTDLAVQILCDRFAVPYTTNSRRSSPSRTAEQLNLRLPEPLERAIAAAFPRRHLDGIRAALCDHYGLPLPDRPARQRAAA